jgi:hypothetical protein
MIFADILFWLLVVAGGYLALNAYWLAAIALFRPAVERCHRTYGTRPVASVLIGLMVLVPTLLVAVGLAKHLPHPLDKLILSAGLIGPGIFALIGSAGLADRIGAGLPSPSDSLQPWRRVLRGGAVLGLMFLVPVLGWFVAFPGTILSGLGAFILSRQQERPRLASGGDPVPISAAGTNP